MDLYEQLNKRFPITKEIIDCYDELVELLGGNDILIDDVASIVDKIKDLKKLEYQLYNEFTALEMSNYIGKLSNNSCNRMDFLNIRINSRLISAYDIMRGYAVNSKEIFPDISVDYELSITDIVNSKINIDTYKNITRKIENLICSSSYEDCYKGKLYTLNMQNYIYKMAIKDTSELLIIDSMFDIQNIKEIDLNLIEKKYFEKTNKKIDINKTIETNIYCLVINFLDSLLSSKMDGMDINSVYYNLFMISHVEVLLDYLSIDKLNTLSLYYEKMVGTDKMISTSVKEIIKRKVKDNNEPR